MSFDDLLNIHLKRFWFLVNQIDRIRAETELRQAQILASVQSAEGFESAVKNLQEQTGQVFVWRQNDADELVIDPKTGRDPEFDRQGLMRLKAMIASQ